MHPMRLFGFCQKIDIKLVQPKTTGDSQLGSQRSWHSSETNKGFVD